MCQTKHSKVFGAAGQSQYLIYAHVYCSVKTEKMQYLLFIMSIQDCARLEIVYSQCLKQNLIMQPLMHLKQMFMNIYLNIIQNEHTNFKY